MINCLPDSDIECFIEEDVPYGDLTTNLLGIGDRTGQIIFSTREETTLCCTEEAARVLQKSGATITSCMPKLFAGVEFLAAQGPTRALHAGWNIGGTIQPV